MALPCTKFESLDLWIFSCVISAPLPVVPFFHCSSFQISFILSLRLHPRCTLPCYIPISLSFSYCSFIIFLFFPAVLSCSVLFFLFIIFPLMLLCLILSKNVMFTAQFSIFLFFFSTFLPSYFSCSFPPLSSSFPFSHSPCYSLFSHPVIPSFFFLLLFQFFSVRILILIDLSIIRSSSALLSFFLLIFNSVPKLFFYTLFQLDLLLSSFYKSFNFLSWRFPIFSFSIYFFFYLTHPPFCIVFWFTVFLWILSNIFISTYVLLSALSPHDRMKNT